jgi:hypothetical protein
MSVSRARELKDATGDQRLLGFVSCFVRALRIRGEQRPLANPPLAREISQAKIDRDTHTSSLQGACMKQIPSQECLGLGLALRSPWSIFLAFRQSQTRLQERGSDDCSPKCSVAGWKPGSSRYPSRRSIPGVGLSGSTFPSFNDQQSSLGFPSYLPPTLGQLSRHRTLAIAENMECVSQLPVDTQGSGLCVHLLRHPGIRGFASAEGHLRSSFD